MPGLQARSPAGERERQTHIDVSLPIFTPLKKKPNKILKKKRNK